MIQKFGRKTSIAVLVMLLIGAAIAAPFLLRLLLLNVSSSVPPGLWFVYPTTVEIEVGAYVRIFPQNFINFAAHYSYPFPVGSSGKVRPFIKQVGGREGDLVEAGAGGIYVNGKLLSDSKVLSADKTGRALTPFPLPYKLKSGELWLISNSPRGFDSRYLGPVLEANCKKVMPLVVKTP